MHVHFAMGLLKNPFKAASSTDIPLYPNRYFAVLSNDKKSYVSPPVRANN